MVARIYKPEKNAMQSGKAGTKDWILEFEPEKPQQLEPLMGWAGFGDTKRQVRLEFDTKEEAIAYARRNGLPFQVSEPREPKLQLKAYADNFRFDRRDAWTH